MRLHLKELASMAVGLSFHGLDALKFTGTTADQNWKERKR